MTLTRTFSTRELAQIWNVSESTIKRWADSGDLCCYRTPGGHRKFQLENISDFQHRRHFEATGLLATESWEEPEVEDSLNRKSFDKVRELIFYLAIQNQRKRVKDVLERLYLRGMGIVELYDEILIPVAGRTLSDFESGGITLGQERLLRNNLDGAVSLLFPQLIRRPHTGRTGLCAAPDDFCSISVNAVSRILETEGWECLNLGCRIPFQAMAEMVEREPVNLVCVVGTSSDVPVSEQFYDLTRAAEAYRIPVVLTGPGFSSPQAGTTFQGQEYLPDFRSLRSYLSHLTD